MRGFPDLKRAVHLASDQTAPLGTPVDLGTAGLRAMVSVAGVVLGWTVTRELLMPSRVGGGSIGLGPLTFVRDMAGFPRSALFLGVALAALLCLARVMTRRTGVVYDDQRAWSFSMPWLATGLILAVLLPVNATACVIAAAALGALLSRMEGTSRDLPVAVAAHVAALLLGVAAAKAVLQPESLLAAGSPRWTHWAPWDLPREVVGAPFLLATGFVLCARASYVLVDRDLSRESGGALRILCFAGCFSVLVSTFWMLLATGEFEFGWSQPNYPVMGGVCCLFALLRLLSAWNPRRLTLEPRAALASGILLHAGLAYGLGQSVLALFVLGIGFAVFGRPAKGPVHRRPSRLAGRIRPSAWPWVR